MVFAVTGMDMESKVDIVLAHVSESALMRAMRRLAAWKLKPAGSS